MADRLAVPFILGAVLLAAGSAAAQPESPGPLSFTVWDAGRVDAAGTGIPVRVYHPDAGGPYPVVGVVHGSTRNGSYMRVLAETLASRGLVAVVPDMPCTAVACDHDANAAQLTALLDWAVAQSGTSGSPLAGLVDGERRGLIGHSWGALGSHVAASRDERIDALVLLDPNDDFGVGLAAAGAVRAPTLQLLAQNPGVCNNQWDEAAVGAVLPEPKLRAMVVRSGHCDPEDPSDSLCPMLCGLGERSTTPYFRRYAVAWIACLLTADPEMAPWLGGTSFDEDLAAGRLRDAESAGLGTLPCRLPPGPDADADGDGDAESDGSADVEVDVPGEADGVEDGEPDARTDDGVDGIADAPADGRPGGGSDGCGCRVASGKSWVGRGGAWVLAAAWWAAWGGRARARGRARSRGAPTTAGPITVSNDRRP